MLRIGETYVYPATSNTPQQAYKKANVSKKSMNSIQKDLTKIVIGTAIFGSLALITPQHQPAQYSCSSKNRPEIAAVRQFEKDSPSFIYTTGECDETGAIYTSNNRAMHACEIYCIAKQ